MKLLVNRVVMKRLPIVERREASKLRYVATKENKVQETAKGAKSGLSSQRESRKFW